MINSFKDRLHAAEIKSEPKFRIEVIQAPEELIELERNVSIAIFRIFLVMNKKAIHPY